MKGEFKQCSDMELDTAVVYHALPCQVLSTQLGKQPAFLPFSAYTTRCIRGDRAPVYVARARCAHPMSGQRCESSPIYSAHSSIAIFVTWNGCSVDTFRSSNTTTESALHSVPDSAALQSCRGLAICLSVRSSCSTVRGRACKDWSARKDIQDYV